AKRAENNGRIIWVPVPKGMGADDQVHTAFILDMEAPGVCVRQRCQFEGCRGIENAHMTFTEVRIPAGNVIGEVGRGLKYALTILNVGRAISIPAICLGMAKQAWQPTLDHANTRLTFQKPLSERQTQRMRLGRMAVNLFTMEALASSVWRLADQHSYDVRIEAAIAKIFCSERTIQFLRDAQIIFGGMGYETADSKRVRGEPAFGIEQLVRDAEMYRIGEGATDILRPFVAREGLSPHLDRAQRYMKEEGNGSERFFDLLKLIRFYVPWYIGLWRRRALPDRTEFHDPKLAQLLVYVEQTSRRLACAIFWAMVRRGDELRDDQGRQTRIEMIGEDLLTIVTAALEASSLARGNADEQPWDLVNSFVAEAKLRIDHAISELRGHNEDDLPTAIGRQTVRGNYEWLSHGIISRCLRQYLPTSLGNRPHPLK
ncbi:MAG TPA: acyl-CoA dehydrogenase, partial [Nitrospiraceae bacterium]